ncbi:hypothetical protein UFOVP53_87 [uncultured Caudovirales phage]|uniref:Uncharacterized protein n=1 Tax=uncultured Caudovirales phage TaxID=2100421 RepID=A0A6J5KVL2_9CAUD|nr:hypothetical protein UFOVP53_87 [uncultured Caudovirales phage]
MASNLVRINNITVKKGDIIEVKFKKIEDILEFYSPYRYRAADVFQTTQIGEHLATISKGGIFHVHDVEDDSDGMMLPEINRDRNRGKDYVRPHEVTITDHNSTDFDNFTFNEHLIESIEVREDIGEHYFSDKFQLSLVKIDGLLVINGYPLDKSDKDLIHILEKTIADISIRAMLETLEEEDKSDF